MITLILYFLITVLLNIKDILFYIYILHNKFRVGFCYEIIYAYNSMQFSMYNRKAESDKNGNVEFSFFNSFSASVLSTEDKID